MLLSTAHLQGDLLCEYFLGGEGEGGHSSESLTDSTRFISELSEDIL